MSTKPNQDSAIDLHVREQGLAAWVARLNEQRRLPLFEALDSLQIDLDRQSKAFSNALVELDWVRETLKAPEHILGSDKTKHGEIAEITEVGLRRAKAVLQHQTPDADWLGVDRFAPHDYLITGTPVQSKFINGANSGLQHVINHAQRYSSFGMVDEGYYHIPKDQYEAIQNALADNTSEFNPKTVQAIQSKVQQLETLKGKPFSEVVRPASHAYADVQQGRIQYTLDRHETDLKSANKALKIEVVEQHQEDIDVAQVKAAPSLHEVGKVALTGAAVGASLQLTVRVYQKWSRDKRTPLQYTSGDWLEIGGELLQGATIGGLSSASLYALTNYSALSAPFAGAVVSSGRAIHILLQQYHGAHITFNEFADLSLIAATEAGIAAAGAALGQAIIPVPVFGAVIGSAILRLVTIHAKQLLEDEADDFLRYAEAQFTDSVAQLQTYHLAQLAELDAEMLNISDLMFDAFDISINSQLLLLTTARLAEHHNVTDILYSVDDVDRFMSG